MRTAFPAQRTDVGADEGPLVCVAIPVYNGAAFIERAVRSALRQTYPRLRVFVADNVSTDETRDIVGAIDDPRLECRFFAEHVPVASSFGRALQYASGDMVLLLAADNELEPDAIATLVATLRKHAHCGLAYGRISVVSDDADRRFLGQAIRAPRVGVVEDLERQILEDGYNLLLDGVLFKRDLPALQMDPEAAGACDLDLLLRVGRAGVQAVGIAASVAVMREHKAALSEKREAMWREALEVLDRRRHGSRHAALYARRMGRLLTWLTVYLVRRGERAGARSYLRRFGAAVRPLDRALVAGMIALPALTAAPLAARRLMAWRSRRAMS